MGASIGGTIMSHDAEVTSFIDVPAYTAKGTFVGVVRSVLLDLRGQRVGSLLLTRTNPKIVEGSKDVSVPYRWVSAISDIVILSHFPEYVAQEEVAAENYA